MYVTSFCSQDVKRLWVDSQERLALWIILLPKRGQENGWYYGLSACWTELFFESWCMSPHLHLGHWFPWRPGQIRPLRLRGLPCGKCGSSPHILLCHVTHIISKPLRSPCISEHWQSSIKFWGKLWNLWNENQFHLHFMETNVAFTT